MKPFVRGSAIRGRAILAVTMVANGTLTDIVRTNSPFFIMPPN